MNKKLLIGIGVSVGVLALTIGAVYTVKKVKANKERKGLSEPNLESGSDEDLAINHGQVIGATLYPSGATANVRSSPVVDNRSEWFFLWGDNNLWTISSPNPVGIVVTKMTGEDKKTWYGIRPLSVPSGENANQRAYVREDVVTFKKP